MTVASTAPARRRATGFLLRLVGSVVVLGALAMWLPLDQLSAALTAVPGLLWLGCLFGFVAGHLAGAFKWYLLLNLTEVGLSYIQAVRFYFAGLFANLFLPSVAGGDVVRAGLVMRSQGSKEAVVFVSLVDRIIDTATLVVFVIVGAVSSRHKLSGGDAVVVGLVALAMMAAVTVAVVATMVPLPAWLPERATKIQAEMRRAEAAIAGNPHRTLVAWSVSMSVQACFIFLTALLGRECGIELSAGAWLFSWPLAKLTAMIPISLAGIGVREAALAGFLGRFGVSAAPAVALGLVWETILVTGSAGGGIVYALTRRNDHDRRPVAADA